MAKIDNIPFDWTALKKLVHKRWIYTFIYVNSQYFDYEYHSFLNLKKDVPSDWLLSLDGGFELDLEPVSLIIFLIN